MKTNENETEIINNLVFLEVYTSQNQYKLEYPKVNMSKDSFILLCIYKYCMPKGVTIKYINTYNFITKNNITVPLDGPVELLDDHEDFVPREVSMCPFPVAVHEDLVISGLCAVARHICKFRTSTPSPYEHIEGLLGFRKNCLQAPNEVSIWTKFCEVDILSTVNEVQKYCEVPEIPINLVRFENHLRKEIRVHNIYKFARDIKKKELKPQEDCKIKESKQEEKISDASTRLSKTRKWKSNVKKEIEIDSSIKIEDLNIDHQFAEGPFLTLSDLILLPLYHILLKILGEHVFASHLPLTHKWSKNLKQLPEMESVIKFMNRLEFLNFKIDQISVPIANDVSLYKCDRKRHNPKKRIFTKGEDIENALNMLKEDMEFTISTNEFGSGIDWENIPDGANPYAGHLPSERMLRKSQQLENLALVVQSIARTKDLIVDFCSGSGHLGILVAYLLPQCKVILLENKEQSLLLARKRVHEMSLKNVSFFQCNLDFFKGVFDIGMALHACGVATDMILKKCQKSCNAKFVVCPCCYGSIHDIENVYVPKCDRLCYPRSEKFQEMPLAQYLCISHAADQTHEKHQLKERGDRCMAIIDSDRAWNAVECGYNVTLTRLKPLSCTLKNNLLIGVSKQTTDATKITNGMS